ncbi:MAG TPA: S8 family serine peptidase [Micromonosporaceae bacterium]|nr:S8 family serine peptidase [Micromonosporaceae bacterium]
MRGRAAIVAIATAALCGFLPAGPAYADGIRDAQWHVRFLDLTAVHRISQGDGVTVAIVDSGVDGTHPDLSGALLPAVDATNVLEATTQSDVDGRGTGLAGLVAGHGHGPAQAPAPPGPGPTTGPGTIPLGVDGVLGIAPHARILPVVITTKPGQYGDPDVLADGIDLAVSRGAAVICIGRGMPTTPRLEQAVTSAVRAGVIVVAPTGGRAGETFMPWPASYPGVVAVAAVDKSGAAIGKPATPPTLAAPGVDLVTTDARGGYRIEAGTGAAAIVAGAAALVRSRYPQLAAQAVVARLTGTSSDRGPAGRDDEYGFGVLDVTAALTRSIPTQPPVPSAAPSPTRPGLAPIAVAPSATPGTVAEPRTVTPAFASGDWRRWLVALPLLGFLVALVLFGFADRNRSGLAGRQGVRAPR